MSDRMIGAWVPKEIESIWTDCPVCGRALTEDERYRLLRLLWERTTPEMNVIIRPVHAEHA